MKTRLLVPYAITKWIRFNGSHRSGLSQRLPPTNLQNNEYLLDQTAVDAAINYPAILTMFFTVGQT